MAKKDTRFNELYRALQSDKVPNLPPEQEFVSYMSAPGDQGYKNRYEFWKAMKDDGAPIGNTYEEFKGMMGLHAVKKPTAQTPSVYQKAKQQTQKPAAQQNTRPSGGTVLPQGFGELDLQSVNTPSWAAQPTEQQKQETAVEKQQRMLSGKATQKEQKQVQSRMQQRKDEIEYEEATGKRLRNPVLNAEFVVPTVARDEKGEMILGENGQPLVGSTTDENRADTHQQVVGEQERFDIDAQLKEAYAERMELQRKMSEVAKRETANRKGPRFPLMTGGTAETYTMSEDSKNLSSAMRLLERRIDALEAKRDDAGFWRGTGDTLSDPSSYSFGLTDLADASVMSDLKSKLDKAKEEGTTPVLTDSEQALVRNYMKNEEAEQLNAENWWYNAGQGFGETLSFMKDFAVTGGGFANIAKAGMRAGAKGGAKAASKLLGDYMTKNLGTKALGKTIEYSGKAAGLMAGAEAGGFLLNNTAQAASSAADIMNRQTGNLTLDKDGNLTFEGGKSLGEAFLTSQISRTGENGSELVGVAFDAIPGILGRVIQRTTPGKVLKRITDSKFWKKGENALDYLGVQSVWGEGMEEEYNMARTEILNQVTNGEYAPEGSGLFDMERQLDTWKTVGLTSMILRVPSMIVSGKQAAGYYANKYNLNTSDRQMRSTFGDEGRYQAVKTALDEADNKDIAKVLNGIMTNGQLSNEEKEATLMYANDLVNVRGFNIGSVVAAANGYQEPPRVAGYNIKGNNVEEVDKDGNVIATHEYENRDDMKAGLYALQQERFDNNLQSDISIMRSRPDNQFFELALQFMESSPEYNYPDNFEDFVAILEKPSMERTDEEQQMVAAFADILHNAVYDNTMLHEEQSQQDGEEIADADSIDIQNGSEPGAAIANQWMAAQENRRAAFEKNDELKQEVEAMEAQGLPHQEIISRLETFRPEDVQTMIDYYNTQSKFNGYMNRKAQKIDEEAAHQRETHTFKGTINGQADVQNVQMITDGTNQYYLVSGNVTTDSSGQITGSTSGLIIGMDLDGSFVQLGDADGYSVMPVEQTLDQFEEAERTRLQEEVTTAIDPTGGLSQPQPTENGTQEVNGAQPAVEAGGTNTGGNEAAAAPETPQGTALDRIPKDEGGNPIYEQGAAEDTYDVFTEMAGSEEGATALAQSELNEANKRLNKLQREREEQLKGNFKGKTIQEKANEMNETAKAIEAEQGRIKYWNSVLAVQQSRTAAEEPTAPETPTPPQAPATPAEETPTPQTDEVPEWRYDNPEAARARGYKMIEGHRVDRQEEMDMPQGMEVEVQYSTKDKVKGRMTVSELDDVQGSHLTNGQRNEKHFLPEAQPKAEFGADRQLAAQTNAKEENFRPELMLTFNGTQSAYSGSASQTNRRGEVVQGNGRRNLAEYIYAPGNEAVAKKYKDFLKAHAVELGTTAEEIDKMEKPFAHIVLDITDDEAIHLGQFTAQDLESGGQKIPEVSTVTTKLGDRYSTFANIVLKHEDPDASLSERIEANADEAVKWLNNSGVINNTEAKTLLEDKAACRQFIKDLITDQLFKDAHPDLRTMFYELPKNIQSAIISVVGREVAINNDKSILKDIQESIRAFHELITSSPEFANAQGANFEKRYAAVSAAVNDWLRQINIDGTVNSEKFSNFALELAKMYKSLKDQKTLAGRLRDYYDLVSGAPRELGMFDAPASAEPISKEQAIKQIFGIEYGRQGTVPLAGNNQGSEEGGEGSTGSTEGGESNPEGTGQTNGGRGNTGNGEVRPSGEAEVTGAQSERERFIAEHPLTEAEIDAANASAAQKILAKAYLNAENEESLTGMHKAAYTFIYNKKVAAQNKPQQTEFKPEAPKEETPKAEAPKETTAGETAGTENAAQAAARAKMAAALAKLKKHGKKNDSQTDAYSVDNLTPEQIEDMFEVVEAGAELGYTLLDDVESKDEWIAQMREAIAEPLKDATGYNDTEVDELLNDMWEYPYAVGEQTKTVGEWASEKGINVNENNNGTESNGENPSEELPGSTTLGNSTEGGVEEGGNNEGQPESGGESGNGSVSGGSNSGTQVKGQANGGRQRTGGNGQTGGNTRRTRQSEQPGNLFGEDGGNGTNDGGGTNASGESANEPTGSSGVGRGSVAAEAPKKPITDINKEKVPYTPASVGGKFAIGSVIPSGIADSIANAFKRLKETFFPKKGTTLDFVREELGYKTNEEMLSDFESGKTDGLAAEQVDAVALAIGKMKEGKSFIVGDMTGVGKGRTAAALIRWGKQHGKKVLFITEKSGLFSDMHRDLTDIGCDYMPFVTNNDADANITDSDGNKVIPKPTKAAQSALWQSGKDTLPKDKKGRQYDFVMTTYSQASNPKGSDAKNKLEWLKEYAKDAIVIMDESHNASGESNRGEYFKELVKEASGVTFLSATFAKRPDNMLIYAIKSSMSEVHMAVGDMLQAIKDYGVAMQELMASALFGSGEMIRRERDMSDVKTTWTDPKEIYGEAEYEQYRKTSDKTMSLFNQILDFQRDFVNPIVRKHEKDNELLNAAAALTGAPMKHTTNTSYKSQASNIVGLMVYAMKAKKAAEMAIEQIKQGKKPVIAVENTFGSYVDELGDEVQEANFRPIFEKGVKFSLKYSTAMYEMGDDGKYHKNKDTEVVFDAEDELDDDGLRALENLRQAIADYLDDPDKLDLTLSPIDLVKQMIADAGYNCGEITGRNYQLERNEDGGYRKVSFKANKKDAARKFNGGSKDNPIPEDEQYQALVLNVAGATGISLHSSKKFGNQQPRTMIILQPARDVNTEVQMRGRIDRTGQEHRGEYFYVTSPIPAEQKLTMMLKQKLASLDAQSVGTKQVSSNKVESQDMDNKYGDAVCYEFLLEHLQDINAYLENGLRYNNKTREWEGRPGLLYDVLKDIQRMPCDMQETVINELSQRYADQIDYLNQNGINDLETATMDLDAVTIDAATFVKGKDNDSENEFAHDTVIERVEVNVLKKPMRSSDIKKKMKDLDALDEDGLPKEGVLEQTSEKVKAVVDSRLEERQKKYDEQEAQLEKKIRENHPKKDEQTEEEYEQMIKSWPTLLEMQNKHKADIAQYSAELQSQYNDIYRAAMYLKPGRPYLVPLTDDVGMDAAMMYGRFLGFQMKNGDPRQVQAVFAVKDSRAMITIPVVNQKKIIDKILSERGDMEIVTLERDEYGNQQPMEEKAKTWDEWWDKMIPKNTNRQIRYMITGNVLQACGSLGKYKGQIVTFTRKNKETGEVTLERGMILAENFDPENFKVRREVEKKDVWDSYDEVKDDRSGISCHREGDRMVVKFEKRKGEKLADHPAQKDQTLKDLAMNNEIRPSGKTAILCVIKEDNVEKALEHLYKEYGYTKEELFVMPDSTEKPDAIVRSNRPYQEIIDEYAPKYGSNKYTVGSKIRQMLKRYKMDVNNEGLKNDIREAVQLRQAYLRKDYAQQESNRMAWEVLILDQRIEQAKDDKDYREEMMRRKEAILEELEYRGFKGTALHLEQGKMTLDDVRKLFDQMNDTSTEEGKAKKALFEKVMAKLEKLPMEIYLNEKIDNDTGGFAGGRIINYNWKYMNADYIADQAKADTILHEMIHTVTAYADRCVEDNLEHLLDQDMVDAINELHSIFDAIKNDDTFTHDGVKAYGLTNVREMLSEAGSNSEFRADLKKTGLWARLKAGFLAFFGIKQNVQGGKQVNAFEQIMERLDYLIENFKQEAWEEYYKGTRYGGYGYKKADAQKIDTSDPIEAIEQAADSWRQERMFDEDEEGYTKEEQTIIDEAKKNGTYMKAPNGKKSNLSPKQWVRVRTEAFKKWFGDWEIASLYNQAQRAWNDDNSKSKFVFAPSERAAKRMKDLLGHEITQLVITDDAIRHIKKNHGRIEALRGQIDMTPDDIATIPYLINNFDTMALDPGYDDAMGNRAIEIRKRINGTSVIATIERGKNKEFVVTAFVMKKSNALDATAVTPGPNVRNDFDATKVKKEIENTKENAKNSSKIVDENGEPMVMSHHTDNEGFYSFDKERIGTGQGQAFLGIGFNFSRGLGSSTYGKRNILTFLNAKDPLRSDKNTLTKNEIRNIIRELNAKNGVDKIEDNWGGMNAAVDALFEYGGDLDTYATIGMTYSGDSKDVMDAFAKRGFDSTIEYDDNGNIMNAVVFEPNQIKSADENVGTYDGRNDDIRFDEDEAATEIPEQGSPTRSLSQPTEQRERIAKHIDKLTKKLGTKNRTTVYRSFDELPEDMKKHIREREKQGRKVRGWYENGRVFLYLPNIDSEYQAERTIWHETVAHYGLRRLIGEENLNKLLDRLWMEHKDGAMGEWVTDRMQRNGWKLHKAIEEYLAREAEEHPFEDPSLWKRLQWLVKEALHKIGFATDPTISDIQYLFWQSQNQLREGDVMGTIKQQAFLDKLNKAADNDRMFDEDDSPLSYSAKAVYDDRLNRVETVFSESYQDAMVSLKTAQNAIAKDKDIPDSQNAYMAENLMHGKNKNEQDLYNQEYRDPLIETINKIMNTTGMNWGDIDRYVYTKSGLERNREFFVRDWLEAERKKVIRRLEDLNSDEQEIFNEKARVIEEQFEDGDIDEAEKNKRLKQALQESHNEYLDDIARGWQRVKGLWDTVSFPGYLEALDVFIHEKIDEDYDPSKHDYSGFRAMYGDEKGKYDEADIIDELMNTEDAINTNPDGEPSGTADTLWEQIRKATRYGLERYREAGMRSDEQIDQIEQMFHWYVPMRGFKEDRGEDMYQYFTGKGKTKNYIGGLLKHAKGRGSEANYPISTIFAMTYKAIADCNQNLVNQKLYRLCQANPNDLIILSDSWAVLNEQTGLWEESSPEIPADASEEEVRQITLDWEEQMKQLAKENKAMKITGRQRFDYVPMDKQKKSEHEIDVRINGKPRKMFVVGNPRMAQALNGQLRFENGKNVFSKWNSAIKNFMASLFTSYSPTFALRNMFRDWTHFRMMLGVREGNGYAKQASKYYRQSLFKMVGMFKKYREGTLDMNNEMERDFKDFMDNGGITGFVQMQKIDDIQKQMEKLYKQQKEGKTIRLNNKLWDYTLGAIEAMNEGIENNARFATYRASRHYAQRTKARSAYDAKEITVNFNRKGAGGKTAGFKSENKKVQNAAKMFGLTSQILGEGRIFFNATVQAIATTFKNFQNPDGTPNKKYISKWAAKYALPPFMFGLALPYINKLLAAALGGDDDDPYANLPEWVRRKNICIYIGNDNFITIPIGQELAAFLTLGDIFAGNTYAQELKPVDRGIEDEMLEVMNTFSPVDISTKITRGGMMEDPISEVTGRTFSVLAPLVAVEQNLGWTGRPVYKEDKFNGDKYIPEYQQVYSGTNPVLVSASQKLHELGGGNENARGKEWSEVNPAIVQYLWEQYTGGPGKVFSNTISIGKDVKDAITGEGSDFNMRKVEGLKAFIQQGDDRTQYYRTQAKFFKYQEDAEKFKHDHNITGLEKQAKAEDPAAKLELDSLKGTVDYLRYEIIKEVNRSSKKEDKVGLDEMRKDIKKTTDRKEKRRKQQAYNVLMKEVVDILDEVKEYEDL